MGTRGIGEAIASAVCSLYSILRRKNVPSVRRVQSNVASCSEGGRDRIGRGLSALQEAAFDGWRARENCRSGGCFPAIVRRAVRHKRRSGPRRPGGGTGSMSASFQRRYAVRVPRIRVGRIGEGAALIAWTSGGLGYSACVDKRRVRRLLVKATRRTSTVRPRVVRGVGGS